MQFYFISTFYSSSSYDITCDSPTGGGLYSKVEMQSKAKKLKKTLQVHRYSSSAQKTKFEDLQSEICVGVEGCLGHPTLMV